MGLEEKVLLYDILLETLMRVLAEWAPDPGIGGRHWSRMLTVNDFLRAR